VFGEEPVEVAGELYAAGAEQDEVVADALQLGDDVRREHHGDAVLRRLRHQRPHGLASGERVEVGEGLVQQDQPRTLAERDGDRDPGALAAGERPDPGLQGHVRVGDEAFGVRLVPGGVELPAHAQRVRHGQGSVQRLLLAEEGEGVMGAAAVRPFTEDPDLAGRRAQHAGGQRHEGGLAGAVRTDEGHDAMCG
jgi:hypothetical protein